MKATRVSFNSFTAGAGPCTHTGYDLDIPFRGYDGIIVSVQPTPVGGSNVVALIPGSDVDGFTYERVLTAWNWDQESPPSQESRNPDDVIRSLGYLVQA